MKNILNRMPLKTILLNRDQGNEIECEEERNSEKKTQQETGCTIECEPANE